MPPKKKSPPVEITTYDLKTMNRPELRAFAQALEADIECLRNYSNFYQKAGDKLASFHEARVKELRELEDSLLDKDRKMAEIRQKVAGSLREKDDFTAYHAFMAERRDERREVEVSGLLQEALEAHLQEMDALQDTIDERERALAAETRKFEMSHREDLEVSARRMAETTDRDTEMFERSVKAYKDMLVDAKRRHQVVLEAIRDETTEDKRREVSQFRDNVTAYQSRLRKYYQNITREDLDTLRHMTTRVKELEDAIATTQSRLKKLQKQNEELQPWKDKEIPLTKPKAVDFETHRKILQGRRACNLHQVSELQAENKLLHRKIRKINEQTDNLRRQFTRALSHVKQVGQGRVHRLRETRDAEGDVLRVFDEVADFNPVQADRSWRMSLVDRVSDSSDEEDSYEDDDLGV